LAVTPVRLLGSAAAAALLAGHAVAQVATSIAPDTAAGFATGSMVSRTGSVVTIAGGARAGGNLFHSFATFDLGAGDTAAWTAADPAGVANVINRVTSGRFSTIAGRIDTQQLPNAAFYFINPAGVLFTDGALLNVPGAAYVSTAADGVRFADGIRFSAVTPDGSTVSMAAPQSFGFLGAEGPIVVDTVTPTLLPAAQVNLSLFASDVAVFDSIFAPRTLDIVTTGRSAVSISLADPGGTAPLDGTTLLSNANIFATQTLKGVASVRVATGNFIQQSGALSSSSFFDGDAGDLLLTARTAEVTGFLASNIGENVPNGDGGTVRLNVGSLHVDAGGQVSSSTFGRGHAGDVVVNAGSILVENFGSIGSDSAGSATGDAGSVLIKADAITVANTASISSSTIGSGAAGEVRIATGTLVVDDGNVSSSTLGGSGRGGLVAIEADSVVLRNPNGRSGIASFTSGDGDAGAVQIKAGSLSLSIGRIFSTSVGSGAAGEISIDVVGDFTATDSFISSDALGVGRAGVVNLRATNATLINSTLTSETTGPGKGGDVTVNAGSLTLSRKSLVATDTFGGGAAGNVTIQAERVSLESSQIVSQASESTGASGTVRITAGRLQLANVSAVSTDTFGAGNAGQIFVKATDVSLAGGSAIASGVRDGASGAGGAVVMDTQSLSLTDDALISSSTFGAGAAGDVNIKAGRVTLDASSIESGSDSVSTGDGGTIRLTADETTLQNGSRIITSTFASGDAGQVVITAGRLRVDGSLLASQSSNRATGAAGGVILSGTTLELTNGGRVETSSINTRMAGPISISMAGPVSVIGAGSHISSENLAAAGGAAGSISIAGAPLRLVDGGLISTNSLGGAAGDINLRVPASSYVLLEGRSDLGVVTTSSGPGTGGRITIAEPLAVISNGGRILALGQQRGANVQLSSNYFVRSADRTNELSVDGTLVLDSQVSDVSSGVVIPDIAFLDASGVLRGQCPDARSEGAVSQLRLRPFGPYARSAAEGPLRLSGLSLGGECAFARRRGDGAPTASLLGRPAAALAAAAGPAQALVTLADVQVMASAGGTGARPLPGWRPVADEATGLVLAPPRSGLLDAAWVREQFVANQLIGRPVPLDRLLALTQLVNLAFVKNGYVNSGALLAGTPPTDGGVLTVRLVYGRAASAQGRAGPQVRFAERGRGGLSEDYVRARLPAAQAVPFNAVRLEEEFRRLAQDPAVGTLDADLVPGAAPGEASLDVVVDSASRYDLYAGVANSRSPAIGGERYAVGGAVRNVLVAGDLVSGEAGVTGGRGDGALAYQAPMGSPSTLFHLRGGYDRAAVVESVLRPLGIRSTDWFIEGGLGWRVFDTPLAPAAAGGGLKNAQSLTLGVRLAHREQRTWLLGRRFSFSPGSVDGLSRYTAARLTADYVRRGVEEVLAISAVGAQGLGGTRYDAAGPLDPSRDFRTLLAQASYARRLNDRLELRLRGAAQWADGPLYTGERFSLGGENTVRGYRENLLLADEGAFASVELARAISLGGGRAAPRRMDWGSFSLSVFADAGVARNRKAPDPDSLASVGVSLAWTPSEALFARVTYGKALDHASLEGRRDLQDHGVGFRMTLRPLALF